LQQIRGASISMRSRTAGILKAFLSHLLLPLAVLDLTPEIIELPFSVPSLSPPMTLLTNALTPSHFHDARPARCEWRSSCRIFTKGFRPPSKAIFLTFIALSTLLARRTLSCPLRTINFRNEPHPNSTNAPIPTSVRTCDERPVPVSFLGKIWGDPRKITSHRSSPR